MEKVFKQAQRDMLSTKLITPYSESYIYKGIKIEKLEYCIKIFNTKKNGDHYKEISLEEYTIFEFYGWRIGCYIVITKNNNRALNNISEKLLAEKNQKNYLALEKYKDTVAQRYLETITNLKNELNV